MIVNVASKCGLTATNYKELNELYDEYAESKGNIRATRNVASCLNDLFKWSLSLSVSVVS